MVRYSGGTGTRYTGSGSARLGSIGSVPTDQHYAKHQSEIDKKQGSD